MSDADDSPLDLDAFSGIARLFPLPNLVMFPHVLQPLHIFEPRYKELFDEALGDDRLMAMAILEPGWEDNYEGRPDLYRVACLGRIATYQRLEGEKCNLLLAGVSRIRIVEELPPRKAFREARVELLEDVYPVEGSKSRAELRARLVGALRKLVPAVPDAQAQLEQLLGSEISLGMLTDVMAYSLDLGHETKRELLAETNVDRRTEILFERLAKGRSPISKGAKFPKFPPDFSAN